MFLHTIQQIYIYAYVYVYVYIDMDISEFVRNSRVVYYVRN